MFKKSAVGNIQADAVNYIQEEYSSVQEECSK